MWIAGLILVIQGTFAVTITHYGGLNINSLDEACLRALKQIGGTPDSRRIERVPNYNRNVCGLMTPEGNRLRGIVWGDRKRASVANFPALSPIYSNRLLRRLENEPVSAILDEIKRPG